jgi:hypothetical protein
VKQAVGWHLNVEQRTEMIWVNFDIEKVWMAVELGDLSKGLYSFYLEVWKCGSPLPRLSLLSSSHRQREQRD